MPVPKPDKKNIPTTAVRPDPAPAIARRDPPPLGRRIGALILLLALLGGIVGAIVWLLWKPAPRAIVFNDITAPPDTGLRLVHRHFPEVRRAELPWKRSAAAPEARYVTAANFPWKQFVSAPEPHWMAAAKLPWVNDPAYPSIAAVRTARLPEFPKLEELPISLGIARRNHQQPDADGHVFVHAASVPWVRGTPVGGDMPLALVRVTAPRLPDWSARRSLDAPAAANVHSSELPWHNPAIQPATAAAKQPPAPIATTPDGDHGKPK